MNKIVVHFGAGALGRGLVVPLLEESGYDVVLVDVNEQLLDAIHKNQGYPLYVTDAEEGKRHPFVSVIAALSPLKDKEKLREALKEAKVITTSVRRENLIHIGRTLLELLEPNQPKVILCAENIENVSEYFSGILQEIAESEREQSILNNLIIPDTIVDRICSASWPEDLTVITESFHELAVDGRQYEDTGITLIPAVRDLEGAFARKRLMVNTFADASSFLALAKGKTYLHEAILDSEIQQELKPYFDSFQTLLIQKYNYSKEELSLWHEKYAARLSNPEIRRELPTVARNLWAKMTLEERFIWPVVELLKLGEQVEDSIAVLVALIKASTGESGEGLKSNLEYIWNRGEYGPQIFAMAIKYL
jgi:mannitol-1-phosphate 5-dehydrogenase